jgi:hypothetical protein
MGIYQLETARLVSFCEANDRIAVYFNAFPKDYSGFTDILALSFLKPSI